MPGTLLILVAALLGFAGLIYSASRFLESSSNIAYQLGISPLTIGLTIVALGTSAPELFVSAIAAINGIPSLAVGNGIGSNIANIGLVVGSTALLASLIIPREQVKRPLFFLLVISLVCGLVFYDARLSRLESILMLLGLLGYLLVTVKLQQPGGDTAEVKHSNLSALRLWSQLLFGLLGLVLFSELLVWSAQGLASWFGVSQLIIGLTVVAVGTSLPELATSVIGVLKGQKDIAIGNIIGSNIFNLLGVIALAGVIEPIEFSQQIFYRDYAMMMGLTLCLCSCYLWALLKSAPLRIGRRFGAFLMVCYILYYVWLL